MSCWVIQLPNSLSHPGPINNLTLLNAQLKCFLKAIFFNINSFHLQYFDIVLLNFGIPHLNKFKVAKRKRPSGVSTFILIKHINMLK